MKSTDKIIDFGAKIGGARKDIRSMYLNRLAAVTNDVLIAKPLSKVYPSPHIAALWRAGEITEPQAVRAWYIWTLIEKKPQGYGVKSWAASTHTILQAFTEVLTSDTDTLPDSIAHLTDKRKAELFREEMAAAGWPATEYKRGTYSVGERLYNQSTVKPYTIISGRYYNGDYATMTEAVARIRELTPGKKNSEATFEIRHWTQKQEYFICPRGKSGIVLRRGIDNVAEARRIITEESTDLQTEYNRLRTFPDERRDWNRPRLGDNFRDGLDIVPEAFGALVPFRGVEFGNWVNQLERAACLNECADGLWDLAKITGVKLDVLAQSGTLAMAFGARGVTKARAHYEPMKRVINITKRTGAGCLAHEYWHSLDNYIMIREGQPLMYAVSDCRHIKNVKIQQAASSLRTAINRSNYVQRSEKIDAYKNKKYWATMVELSARAFEAFIYFKMKAVGMSNDYLVNFKTLDEYDRSDCYPYPTREESETFAPFFESFFDAVFSAEERSNIVALPLCAAPAIAATPEAEAIIEATAEVINTPVAEVIQVEEIPTYEEVEKSPFFPEALADHRKYFATVETFCNSFNLIYHFDLLNEKKVRLFVMFLNGEKVFFDYEVTSRHRDVFAFREHDEKHRRLKNWSVAIETMKRLLNQPSGASPEGTGSGAAPNTEIVTYGDTEKSLPMPIAASESTASSDRRQPVRLKEEDETRMDDLNQKNGYCIAHKELLRLGFQHEKDFNRKHFYSCELIEYRLTNINCHSYCGLLYAGKYEEFKKMVNKQIKEEDMKATDNIAYGESEKSPVQLLPENVTLELITESEVIGSGSATVAKRIIAEGLEKRFEVFRGRDKYANRSLNDLRDTVLEFQSFGAEIRLYGILSKSGTLQFLGMKPDDTLRRLFDYAREKYNEAMDECSFKLRGVKGFLPYNSYLFHQCFAEGRITVDELIKMLQEQED